MEIKRKALKILEIEAVKSVRKNFEEEGRPDKWKPKLIGDGRKILSGKSGDLLGTISSTRNESMSMVIVKFGTVYAEIHNKGGRINMTERMRKFFWAMFRATGDEIYKNMALNKKGYIEIPKREFAKLTEEDIERIKEQIAEITL